MSSSINYTRNRKRSGFTLVELLVVVSIIGLLVGMLAVVGGGVIGTAREFAVNSEITQLSQATESFRTKYGFYPPSFEQFKRSVNTGDDAPLAIVNAEAAQLLPFLNKISANHREASTPSPVMARAAAGYTLLDDWWEFVGCNLDQSSSLQFWLSGLSENKQFPLTGGLTFATPPTDPTAYLPVGFNSNNFLNGTEMVVGSFERESFYDFDTDRFIPLDIFSGGTLLNPTAQYVMEYGKSNGDLFYIYRDSGSYQPVGQPNSIDPADENNMRASSPNPAIPASAFPSIPAYLASDLHRGPAYYSVNDAGTPEFANPNTFQIISFGLDGDPGVAGLPADLTLRGLLFDHSAGVAEVQLSASGDNLCNFADGRLDKFITEQQ